MKIVSRGVDDPLPATVTPVTSADQDSASLIAWLKDAHAEWSDLLLGKGSILFRGFDVRGTADLERIIRAIGPRPLGYVGGNSPRTRVSDKVYTSTEYPADQRITLHNELSYAQSWPMRIVFCCETPAASGGETPIADSRVAMRLLPKALVERFEAKGLIYLQTLHGGTGIGRSWQASFETTDRSVVEQLLSRNGVEFEWTKLDSLKIRYHRKATEVHPVTGQILWFNQADQWHPSNLDAETRRMMEMVVAAEDFPHNVTFGDGGSIPEEDIATIRDTLWENAVVSPWQRHDVLLLDNMLVAHGRRPYKGQRKVYVAMA